MALTISSPLLPYRLHALANLLTSRLTANTAHDLQLTGYPSHDLSFAPITSGTFVSLFYPEIRQLTDT